MIRIITDSACDLPQAMLEQYQIKVLPMNITFGEETFHDQTELSTAAFYQRLTKAGEPHPRTAYPTLGLLKLALEEEIAAGNEIILITLANALSGYYHAAQVLLQDYPEANIALFDSKSATLGQGVIVLAAARLVEAGKSYAEVVAAMPELIVQSRGYGVINNLDYLKRGGRISSATAFVAGALNIKPVININEDGSLTMVQKVRGMQKGLQWLRQRLKEDGQDFTKAPFFIGYIIQKDTAEQFLTMLQQEFQLDEVHICEIGPTVGTHLGPGCVALFYLKP